MYSSVCHHSVAQRGTEHLQNTWTSWNKDFEPSTHLKSPWRLKRSRSCPKACRCDGSRAGSSEGEAALLISGRHGCSAACNHKQQAVMLTLDSFFTLWLCGQSLSKAAGSVLFCTP